MFRKKKTIVTQLRPNQWRDTWKRLMQNKAAMVGLCFIVLILILALFADVIADYNNVALAQYPLERLQGPSPAHWLGTDAFGRDLFARIIHGARYSLAFGVICTGLALLGGCILGATSAFFGGKVDNVIMRIMDAMMCIPAILLSLSLVSALGQGLQNMMIALVIANIPSFTRMIRSVVLTVVTQDYIEAARSCGVRSHDIIFRHVLPNAIGPIIVNAMMSVAGFIMSAAGLSFIGMGIAPPAPEWGNMLSEAVSSMRLYPHVVIVPGVAIVLTALSFNLLGDGLTDALDPRLQEQ